MNSWFDSFSNLPLPVCFLSKDLDILNKNPAWTKEFEFSSPQESILKEKLLDALKKSHGNESIQIEHETFLWSISFDQKKDGYLLVGQNLTNFHALEVKYERVYQTTTDAIMLLDETGFTDCNHSTLEIFKLKDVSEFTKCHPADLSPPLQPDGENSFTKANRMIAMAMKDGRNFFEWVHRNKEGQDFTCEVLLSRLEIAGKPQLQASVRDISERMKLQKEIEDSKIAQINAARLAALGEMAGGIAHEINNPLSIIRGHAEQIETLLKRSEKCDPGILTRVEKIVKTSDRISTIIKGLKQLSRDSSNDPYISSDLITVINQLIEISRERLKLYQISFDMDCKYDELPILCRPVEISQVFLNLINNSIDAIQDKPSPWIRIEVTKTDSEAIVKVIDSGPGIDPSIVNKISQPFFTTKEIGKGTGLGLSISKKIIEKHHGQFILDVNAKNTTFVLKLKLATPSMLNSG